MKKLNFFIAGKLTAVLSGEERGREFLVLCDNLGCEITQRVFIGDCSPINYRELRGRNLPTPR